MRAENARIVGLELPIWPGRKRREPTRVAEPLEVPTVSHRRLRTVAAEHGLPLQRSMRPPRHRPLSDLARGPGLIPKAALTLAQAIRGNAS